MKFQRFQRKHRSYHRFRRRADFARRAALRKNWRRVLRTTCVKVFLLRWCAVPSMISRGISVGNGSLPEKSRNSENSENLKVQKQFYLRTFGKLRGLISKLKGHKRYQRKMLYLHWLRDSIEISRI